MDTLKAGDRIRIQYTDAPNEGEELTVCSILSDQEEGFGPEVADYVACWLEVSRANCAASTAHFLISLGTDFQYSMDGRHLTIEKIAT